MLMLKWHLPTPMPTSTINPREVSDTISLFTEMKHFNPEHKRRFREEKGRTCDRGREYALDHCPHPFVYGQDGVLRIRNTPIMDFRTSYLIFHVQNEFGFGIVASNS